MKVEIKLIVSQDEFSEYCGSYYEEHGELPTMQLVQEYFNAWFIANHSDYTEYGNFKLVLQLSNGKEVNPFESRR